VESYRKGDQCLRTILEIRSRCPRLFSWSICVSWRYRVGYGSTHIIRRVRIRAKEVNANVRTCSQLKAVSRKAEVGIYCGYLDRLVRLVHALERTWPFIRSAWTSWVFLKSACTASIRNWGINFSHLRQWYVTFMALSSSASWYSHASSYIRRITSGWQLIVTNSLQIHHSGYFYPRHGDTGISRSGSTNIALLLIREPVHAGAVADAEEHGIVAVLLELWPNGFSYTRQASRYPERLLRRC